MQYVVLLTVLTALVVLVVLVVLVAPKVEAKVEAAPPFFPLTSASASTPSQLRCCAIGCVPKEQHAVGPIPKKLSKQLKYSRSKKNTQRRSKELSTKNCQSLKLSINDTVNKYRTNSPTLKTLETLEKPTIPQTYQ